ncbi:MAG: hypothetical protein BWX54_02148 [Verrucomicrobia bacterium ADurb.Bin018]|jgi:hypothetical protein|nr:MAG: hypothetical protein BWX54_02148 [Verrucomicrobia bacterium ADurb.Bin018]HOU57466.1 hypothetical protein [Smithellaceae bacterium]
MNKFIASLTLLVCLCFFAHAKEPPEMDRIHGLDAALQKGGLSELLSVARQHRWQAPRMPSKWSVEHRSYSDEQRKVDLAGRQFGRKLAVQLDAIAPVLQDLPPSDELNRKAHMLCDLSDWCASTLGYGNLFLAQRCLDLAVVGLGRLTASLDFPLAECENLAARMSPAWMSVEARARTLNDDAGTNLFAVDGTQAEMEKTWGSGGFLMREKRSGISRAPGQEPGRGFIETPALKANLDFFERDEPSAEPLTLVRSWDAKRYERIVNGLELQNANKALALLKFRSVIGQFPEKISYTEDQLRAREEMRALHEKLGVEANISNNDHVSGKAAFLYAWDQRKDKDPKDHNLDAQAWQAYSEVKTGQFMDQDTRAERMAAPDIHAQ